MRNDRHQPYVHKSLSDTVQPLCVDSENREGENSGSEDTFKHSL